MLCSSPTLEDQLIADGFAYLPLAPSTSRTSSPSLSASAAATPTSPARSGAAHGAPSSPVA